MAETEALQKPKAQLGTITGLRFIAAFGVMYGHFQNNMFGVWDIVPIYGPLAVSFFFVLSGFILTYVSHDVLGKKKGSIKKYYVKRFARIWPVHFLMLMAAIFVVKLNFESGMFWNNFFLLQSWTTDWVFSYNGVSWSISTESFFYVVFPLLLIGGERAFWIKCILVWVGVFALIQYLQAWIAEPGILEAYHWDQAVHVNPIFRLPEFCTGMGVAFLFHRQSQKPKRRSSYLEDSLWELVAISSVAVLGFYLESYLLFVSQLPYGGKLPAVWAYFSGGVFVFAFVVWIVTRTNGFLATIMNTPMMVLLGQASYSLFMVHYMVIVYCNLQDWTGSEIEPWKIMVSIMVMSTGLSIFVYQFVEEPARALIVNLYDRKYTRALMAWPDALKRYVPTRSFIFASCLVILPIVFLTRSYSPVAYTPEMNRIAASNPHFLKSVYFGDHLRLLGREATTIENGIRVDLIWQRLGPVHRKMFIHVLDEDGKILKVFSADHDKLSTAKKRIPFMESFEIGNTNLETAHSIGIGLYSPELDPTTGKSYGSALVSKGPRSMTNQRLEVVSGELLKLVYVPVEEKPEDLGLDTEMTELISQSSPELKDVYIGPNLRLLGAFPSATESGIEIKLVWYKYGPIVRNRFAHCISSEGKVTRILPLETELFKNAPEKEAFIEVMAVSSEELASADCIGIGFFAKDIDPETGKPYTTLDVSKGPRSMSGRRLHIVSPETMESLRPQIGPQ